MTIRSALKGLLGIALNRSGIATVARIAMRSRTLILAYHNIVSGELRVGGDRSLHLPRQRFSDQLDQLIRTCDVVPLDAIFNEHPAGVRPRVAITFDDAYRGAVTIGVEELARRGLPATIFVSPAFIGGKSFWWDAIVERSGRGGLGTDYRALALGRYRGEDIRIRSHAAQHGMQELPVAPELVVATEAELHAAAAVPGITFGSHTWSHPNLATLNWSELTCELTEPLRWLHERFDCVLPWLSYPYGKSSELVEQATEAAGYTAALRVSGGWLPSGRLSRYALPRFNVPSGLSLDGFALRTAGLLTGGSV